MNEIVKIKWYGGSMILNIEEFINCPKTPLKYFCKKVLPLDSGDAAQQLLAICDRHLEEKKDKPRILEHYAYVKELIL